MYELTKYFNEIYFVMDINEKIYVKGLFSQITGIENFYDYISKKKFVRKRLFWNRRTGKQDEVYFILK